MQTLLRFATLTFCAIVYSPAFSQAIESDSLKTDSTRQIQTTPFYKQSQASLGYAVYPLDNKILKENYAGSSVFNLLPGQVPNLDQDGWRGYGNTTLIVDGVYYHDNLKSIGNLNSFNYSDVVMISGGHATVPFGSNGRNGALILTSQTGENVETGQFDFNTQSAFTLDKQKNNVFVPERRSIATSNSLSYKKDFGKIDGWVGFNYQGTPHFDNSHFSEDRNNDEFSYKINLGYTPLSRMQVRMILEKLTMKSQTRISDDILGTTPPSYARRSNNKYDQSLNHGLLSIAYSLFSWLDFSSNFAIQRSELSKYDALLTNLPHGGWPSTDNLSVSDMMEDRKLLNVGFRMHKQFSKDFSAALQTGLMMEDIEKDYYQFQSHMTETGSSTEMESNASQGVRRRMFVNSLQTSFKNFWHINVHYRNDDFKYSEEIFSAVSITNSFVLSEALDLHPFSLLQIRSAYTYSEISNGDLFPVGRIDPEQPVAPGLPKRSFEVGVDMGLLNDRLAASLTFFLDKDDDMSQVSLPPFIPGGFYFVDVYMKTEGIEMTLNANVIQKRSLRWNIGLQVAYYKRLMTAEDEEEDNFYSEWTYSVINQLNFKGFSFNVIYDLEKANGNSLMNSRRQSLSDLSLGYRFQMNNSNFIKKAYVSISCWNLFSEVETEWHNSMIPISSTKRTLPKSFLLNINLTF